MRRAGLKKISSAIVIAWLTAAAWTTPAIADEVSPDLIRGEPLQSFNLHPVYMPFMQVLPMSPRLQTGGRMQLSVLGSYGNNFFLDPVDGGSSQVDADLDSEAFCTGILLTAGFGNRFEINAMVYGSYHYGGFLDSVIEGYHGVFGFPNAGRELRDRGRTRFFLENSGGTVLDEDGSLGSAALTVEPRYQLRKEAVWMGGVWDLAAGFPVKLPLTLGRHGLDGTGIDAGVRLFAGCALRRFNVAGAIGLMYLSMPEFAGDDHFSPVVVPFFFSAGWQAGRRLVLLSTVQGSTSPFSLDYDRTDRFTAVVNVGARIRCGSQGSVQLSFSEEFFTFAATDIGFNIGWSTYFGG
ncbi:MAG: DUF3187 family protein [Sediminispirochaetaceae bacterium]